MADGDFDRKVKIYSNDEIGQLARAFNYLTTRLKEALSQNEKEKEKLSAILSNMTEGVIAADPKGEIILVNQRATEMLHKSEKEMYDKTLFQLFDLPEDEEIASIVQNEESLLIENTHSTGHFYLIRVTFSALKGMDSGDGVIAVLQDVTEQEKLEQERKEFVANVSHELRTPLTTLKSYMEALNEGAYEDKELAPKFIHVTLNETDRMIRLVNDLLKLSRLDSEAVQLIKKKTNMEKLVSDIAERFSVQLKQQRLAIHLHAQPGLPEVWVDRDAITQVLDNLLSNAIKYSNQGSRIYIHIELENGQLAVKVKDTGQGIPKHDVPRVFDRFYRVDKARSRKMGGTGLGLSISQEIIHLHGGTIKLESELNRGTEVTFYLPLKRPAEDEHSIGQRRNA